MAKFIYPIITYAAIILFVFLLPTSEGYDDVTWRFLIGNMYAVPYTMSVFLIAYNAERQKKRKLAKAASKEAEPPKEDVK